MLSYLVYCRKSSLSEYWCRGPDCYDMIFPMEAELRSYAGFVGPVSVSLAISSW